MHHRSLTRVLFLAGFALAITACSDCGAGPSNTPDGGSDGGNGLCVTAADCGNSQQCLGGTCVPADWECVDNGGCAANQVCNAGFCEAAPVPDGGTTTDGGTDGGMDAGVDAGPQPICNPGATRCNATADGIETCSTDGFLWELVACDTATPVCLGAACVVCGPGETQCNGDIAQICKNDGSGYTDTDCSLNGGTCKAGVCQACVPNSKACADATTLRTCNATGSNFTDQLCLGGLCDDTLTPPACVITSCTSGSSPDICQGDVVMTCDTNNEYVASTDCAAANGTCQAGQCISLCDDAVSKNSYIGCEYWPTPLSNTGLAAPFRNSFAVTVANPNAIAATVDVYEAAVPTAPLTTVTVAPGALEIITLPYTALDQGVQCGDAPAPLNPISCTTSADCGDRDRCDTTTGECVPPFAGLCSFSTKGKTAYRMTSTIPVTAYQFNPLPSALPVACDPTIKPNDPACVGKGNKCQSTGFCANVEYSYSNDASLLLPTHIFGDPAASPVSTYVSMILPHVIETRFQQGLSLPLDYSSMVAVVGTEDNTQVTITARGSFADSLDGSFAEMRPGDTRTVTLNKHEVLQLSTREFGAGVRSGVWTRYPESDPSGTIFTADKPIAIFSGSDCRNIPFDTGACDHIEQQLFPFRNWASSYVAAAPQAPPGGDPAVGAVWRILAAVDGTTLTFDPPVATSQTLNAGEWFEIQTATDFRVTSQDIGHPIMVAEFLVGQLATGSSFGDPSMILATPSDQYRDNYVFTIPSTYANDYVNIVRPAGTVVAIDGTPISTTWAAVGSTGLEVGRYLIPDGTHSLVSDAPVGLTVYGYDNFVSYGYPGGLDLRVLVVINPGG